MKKFTNFFLFCAGVNKNILKRSPSDTIKYAGIGATIFFTGLMAAIAGSYAIYTVFQNWIPAVVFGIVWGAMIFNLDRYIVSSMKARANVFKDFIMALPRLALAILIAIVIAKPLELKIFDSEIQAELVSMEQEKLKEQEDRLKERFELDMQYLSDELTQLKSEIDKKQILKDELSLMALQEADGTGGSMKKNLGPIYRAKKSQADAAQNELANFVAVTQPLIHQKQQKKDELFASMQSEMESLRKTELNGFAARLNALSRLAEKNSAILWASLFITFLFIAIECAPIFVKLVSYRSPYDFVLHKHEHQFEMNHKERTSSLQNTVLNRLDHETKTRDYQTSLLIQAENQLVDQMVQKELDRWKQNPPSWKEYLSRGKIFNLKS